MNSKNNRQLNDHPFVASILFAALLFFTFWLIGFSSGYYWYDSSFVDIVFISGTILMFIFIIPLAVYGRNPQRRGWQQYIGLLVLFFIPVVGLIVVFWAAKGLTRKIVGSRISKDDNIEDQ